MAISLPCDAVGLHEALLLLWAFLPTLTQSQSLFLTHWPFIPTMSYRNFLHIPVVQVLWAVDDNSKELVVVKREFFQRGSTKHHGITRRSGREGYWLFPVAIRVHCPSICSTCKGTAKGKANYKALTAISRERQNFKLDRRNFKLPR
jgi:hypothetical protein